MLGWAMETSRTACCSLDLGCPSWMRDLKWIKLGLWGCDDSCVSTFLDLKSLGDKASGNVC